MALRLPRLPMLQPLWPQMQRWWQSVVEAIETAFSGLEQVVADLAQAVLDITAAQAAADAAQVAADDAMAEALTKQPLDATLTSLAALAWGAGRQVVVFTAADTSTLVTVGASAATDILDRAAGDVRYAASGSGVLSFNARTGAVTLLLADVTGALGYTPTSVTGLTGVQSVAAFKTGLSLVKGDVGLGSVDNTADAAKNVLSATKLTIARTIAISGGATGTATSFDGTGNITIPVTALDMGNASAGTLVVARGGTGTTTSTGTGSVVLDNAPTFSGRTQHSAGATMRSGASLQMNDAANTLGITLSNNGTLVTFSAGVSVTGQVIASTFVKPGSFTVAGVPSASTSGAGAMIFVSNESGGSVIAFSDGTNWRRVTDRAIIT